MCLTIGLGTYARLTRGSPRGGGGKRRSRRFEVCLCMITCMFVYVGMCLDMYIQGLILLFFSFGKDEDFFFFS